MSSIRSRLIDVVAQTFPGSAEMINQLKDGGDVTFSDIGADSLDEVEFIMEIEEEFDMDISDDDAEQFKSFSQVLEYIQSKK